MPKISIILPVYNVERYLEACLNSIAAQSFTDWECICVNDGSTDGSINILEAYSTQDKRIKVLNQINSGPAVARSHGIREASGEFLLFQDADDFIEPDMYEVLYEEVAHITILLARNDLQRLHHNLLVASQTNGVEPMLGVVVGL